MTFSLIDLHFAPGVLALELALFGAPLAASLVLYRRYRPVEG